MTFFFSPRSYPPCWRCSERPFFKVQRESLCYRDSTVGDCGEQRRPDWERCKTNQTESKPTVFADIYVVKHLAAECAVPHLGETWGFMF